MNSVKQEKKQWAALEQAHRDSRIRLLEGVKNGTLSPEEAQRQTGIILNGKPQFAEGDDDALFFMTEDAAGG